MLRALVAMAAVVAVVTLLTLPFSSPEVRERDADADPDADERADPDEVYDPVEAGEPLPEGWRQLLGRDRISPIYRPRFVTADEADWPDDTLVLGVELGGEARAYPINILNRREMVNDVIGDNPVLASW